MRRLVPLLMCVPLLAAVAPAKMVRYTLSPELTGDALTALKVQVRFQASASGTAGFGWEERWAGEGALSQWVRDFRVAGATAVYKNAAGHWRIKALPGAQLIASYKIVSAYDHDPTVDDSDQARPVIRPRWFYAVGNALFGHPDDSEQSPATFDWSGRAPGIGFASDLEHLAGRSRKARRPGTVSDVLESIVLGGRDLRIFAARAGSGVRVATIGHFAFSAEQLDTLAREVIRIERDFWKADRSAPFLVTATPIASSPASTRFGGTGRGDGFALWIDQRAPLSQMKWLLAHEYFHTWSPRQLGTMPSDQANRPTTYWFSEGFTDYYARALMVRTGLITPTEFADLWNEMLLAYAASPARDMPGARAASAFWTDEAAQKLPYQRGAMLAAMWNARELTMSHGRANLDTILKAQLAAARSHRRDAAELFGSLAKHHGLDIAADEARYLRHGKLITLPPDTFGRCATVVTQSRPAFSPGFDGDATANAHNVATGVDPASPAYAAGLRNGMTILARTEGEPDNSLVPYALLVEDRGRQRTIRYLPQSRRHVVVQQLKIRSRLEPGCPLSLGGAASMP